MKSMKKILSLVLVLVMLTALSATAFAQTIGTAAEGKGSITISNASRGETYTIYKLFDATVAANGSIAYTGTVPSGLTDYFQVNSAGNIQHGKMVDGEFVPDTDAVAELTAAEIEALTTWAENATETAHAVSDGTTLVFEGLDYGYYVVTTTHKDYQTGEAAISVDSTNPNVTIVDKNKSIPIDDPKKYAGEVEEDTDNNVYIGQTVTYTIEFGTANYNGSGADAKKIMKYTISDDFASGVLTDVVVSSITIDNEAYVDENGDTPQFVNGEIEIDWYDETNEQFRYKNGAQIVITYTATVAATAAVDGDGNTNHATITATDEGGGDPWEEEIKDTIYTFAIAIQKVDQNGNGLAGATFQFPFYVQETADTADGAYIYAGTAEGEGLVNELTTPDSGLIIVKGVIDDTYIINETAAPAGYNKIDDDISVTAVKTGEKSTTVTKYYDKDGKEVDTQTEETVTVTVSIEKLAATPVVVFNKSGAELPTTGGIGTTLFYVFGSILVLGAGIVLVTKRRVRE